MADSQTTVGSAGIPKGAKTSEYYKTTDVPVRFDNPEWFKGYKTNDQHPLYKTSNCVYGSREPSVHTMPVTFHAKSNTFSGHLGVCGMYRNHSLNCTEDKAIVPDH